MEKKKDTLVIFRRFLLVEKIKNIEPTVHGHRYWYDTKGIYSKYSDIKSPDGSIVSPILISYPGGDYKSFYPDSVSYHLYWDKSSEIESCYIYEEKFNDFLEEDKYIYHSSVQYLKGEKKINYE